MRNTITIFTKDPAETIEDIIVNVALLEQKMFPGCNNAKINIDNIFKKIGTLATKGLYDLRRSGQNNKKNYELFIGCIFALFLNSRDKNFKHIVSYPDGEGYDVYISKHLQEEKLPTWGEKKDYNHLGNYKIEITEVFKSNNLIKNILKKLNSNHDYKERTLLVGIQFCGEIKPNEIFKEILKEKQKDNFDTICLVAQREKSYKEPKLNFYFIIYNIPKKKYGEFSFEYILNMERVKSKLNKKLQII